LARPFIQTASWCLQRRPGLRFVAPLVNERVRALFFQELQRTAPHLPFTLVSGRSREVIALAEAVLTASGTATLETLLLKRPMVVAYRLNALSYHIVKGLRLVKVPFIAMANLLAGEALAPEFIQQRCRSDLLGPALLNFLDDPNGVREIQARYAEIHRDLRRDASREAAEAVLGLVGGSQDD
jgi:lipid-A-disaccharide synthase